MHVCTLASRGKIFAHLQLVIDAKAYFSNLFFVTELASALYQASVESGESCLSSQNLSLQ